ncbi:DUF3596 domain-containing protein [Leptolyngbya sp. DQ-M1]|uniref:Arm DNA-binding domain-containing protein n=1 Tax=Leptolyngbya sp. DQ-M1 TaxID=2933920 RepID=UPI003297B139
MDKQKRSSKGSVGVEPFQNRLRLRLPRQLFDGKQKYLTLGLEDTIANRKIAEAKAKQIESDIVLEKFDYTLDKYRPDHAKSVSAAKAIDLSELWTRYTQFKSTQVEETTLIRDYGKIEKRIRKFPKRDLDSVVIVRDYLLKTYSAEVAKRTFKELNACCNWGIRSKLIDSNPFIGMVERSEPRSLATRPERPSLEKRAKRSSKHSRITPTVPGLHR